MNEIYFLRGIDVQNAECRAEYERRRLLRLIYPDMRGDITGPTIDQDYAMKRMLARAFLKDIREHKERRKVPVKVVYWPKMNLQRRLGA